MNLEQGMNAMLGKRERSSTSAEAAGGAAEEAAGGDEEDEEAEEEEGEGGGEGKQPTGGEGGRKTVRKTVGGKSASKKKSVHKEEKKDRKERRRRSGLRQLALCADGRSDALEARQVQCTALTLLSAAALFSTEGHDQVSTHPHLALHPPSFGPTLLCTHPPFDTPCFGHTLSHPLPPFLTLSQILPIPLTSSLHNLPRISHPIATWRM